MLSIVVQGINHEDFLTFIDDCASGDLDGHPLIVSTESLDIELYDDEKDITYRGAKALSLIIEHKRQELKGEQNGICNNRR